MPVHLFGRPAPDLARLRPAGDRGRGPGVRRGRDRDEHRLDVQLLPDEEPLRARRRRADRRQRRRRSPSGCACCASTARGRRRSSSTSATTRGSTRCRRRSCGSSCGTSARGTRSGARPPRATPSCSTGLVETPDDDPGHVYHVYCVRSPERDRLAAAPSRPPTSASPSYYEPPLHLQPALAYLGYSRGRLPRDREGVARESLPAAVGRDHGGAAGRGRLGPEERLRARRAVKLRAADARSRSTGTGSGSSSSTRC